MLANYINFFTCIPTGKKEMKNSIKAIVFSLQKNFNKIHHSSRVTEITYPHGFLADANIILILMHIRLIKLWYFNMKISSLTLKYLERKCRRICCHLLIFLHVIPVGIAVCTLMFFKLCQPWMKFKREQLAWNQNLNHINFPKVSSHEANTAGKTVIA